MAGSPTVLVVGAGGIGAFYGALLAKQGAAVSVVCRSDFEAVSRDGFSIKSPLGDRVFRPAQVLRSAADGGSAPDYLLLCVKVLDGEDRAGLIRPAVGRRTVIVLIENGIDIEAEIAQAFPDNELISALAYVGVARVAPGKVVHQAFGHLAIGNHPSGVTDATRRLAVLFESAGVQCKVMENVQTARWQKAVWNAVLNPISVLGGVLDTRAILATEEGREFVRQGMREVCAIAAAAGHPLADDLVEQLVTGTRQMPAYKTSMAVDYENGRPMEVEAILGNAVRAARRHAVATPALDALYALMKIVQMKQANKE